MSVAGASDAMAQLKHMATEMEVNFRNIHSPDLNTLVKTYGKGAATSVEVARKIARLFSQTTIQQLQTNLSTSDRQRIIILADMVWDSKLFKSLTPQERSIILQVRATLEPNPVIKLAVWLQHAICAMRDRVAGTKGLGDENSKRLLDMLDAFERTTRHYRAALPHEVSDPEAIKKYIDGLEKETSEELHWVIRDEITDALREKRPSKVDDLRSLEGYMHAIISELRSRIPLPARRPPPPPPPQPRRQQPPLRRPPF